MSKENKSAEDTTENNNTIDQANRILVSTVENLQAQNKELRQCLLNLSAKCVMLDIHNQDTSVSQIIDKANNR